MDKLIYLLPILACTVMMGAMMWMMRGHHSAPASAGRDTAAQIAALRNEIAALRIAQAGEPDTTQAAPVNVAPTGTSVP